VMLAKRERLVMLQAFGKGVSAPFDVSGPF
jgi:hypothetical protein